MRGIDLVEELEKKFPNDIMMIEELTEKERFEYIAAIKLIAYMKMLLKDN